MRRVFLMVLDSFGIGEMPDAARFGDAGSNTLGSCRKQPGFAMPNMEKLGLFAIDGVEQIRQNVQNDEGAEPYKGNGEYAKNTNAERVEAPFSGCVARMQESSVGKDTTTGHWEIAGLVSTQAMPVFPEGFPKDLLDQIRAVSGKEILCNKPYSGTDVIRDYGDESIEKQALIVYTSADSVLQIAAHEKVADLAELYRICEECRKICVGGTPYGVGRVIARPFIGKSGSYERTSGRHDYSLKPTGKTMLDYISEAGKSVYAIGKISDIYAGCGVTKAVRTAGNTEGMKRTLEAVKTCQKEGLIFTNLVDFDMLYGHRNDVVGYANALMEFDRWLPDMLAALQDEDILIITADHGCDPCTPSTDHSREYTPCVMYGPSLKQGVNLGTRSCFGDIGATILDYLEIPYQLEGESMLDQIKK